MQLKPVDPSKRIYVQEPDRDLGQVNDSRIRLDGPLMLANHAEIAAWNAEASDPHLFVINGVEVDSGAGPEVNVQAGFRTLQSVERQGAVLPKTGPDGSPFIMAFLVRARCGFCRDARPKPEKKLQYKYMAQAANKHGQIAKLSDFDAGHRASWLKGDVECFYELIKEGVPLIYEIAVSVSDDPNLTPEAFRQRVRSFLEMDAEVRKSMGIETSAMRTIALKNTDGRLRGDDVGFAEGNTYEYTNILIEEGERIHEITGSGPTEIRFHTHQIGYANSSGEAFLHCYLSRPTHYIKSACLDALPNSRDFPNLFAVINGLKENRGWDISLSPRQERIGVRKGFLLDRAAAPFRDAALYTPTNEEWQRFHCAPAAWPSGIRLGALKHVRRLKEDLPRVINLENEGPTTVDNEIVTSKAIYIWGCLNAACKRLLGGTYSITPVANYHNQSAGDMMGRLIDNGTISTHIAFSYNMPMPDAGWDEIVLANHDAIQQVPTAGYMTRSDLDVQLDPRVFAHLCKVRTAAVLPEDQAKSFFAEIDVKNYAQLREELLASVTDKNTARGILVAHKIPQKLRARFIQKYIGHDTSPASEEPPEVLPKAQDLIAKLAGDDVDLRRELELATVVGGSGGKVPERQLHHIATMPSNTHNNLLWWEGVGQFNAPEQHLWDIFKNEGVATYQALFDKNPAAANAAAIYYIEHACQCRHDFGLGDALFHTPSLSRQTAALRIQYQRQILGHLISPRKLVTQPLISKAA